MAAEIRPGSLKAKDTADLETPTAAATSLDVGRLPPAAFRGASMLFPCSVLADTSANTC
ncbi:hypothetical protein GCM10028793_20880 [Nocardiopsis oceani]